MKRSINPFGAVLAITVVGALATFAILHVAIDVPFQALLAPSAYAIGASS